MDEKKTPQPEQAAPETGKPLSEKRKSALLRYMAVLFCAAFILVLISLILQTHSSKAKISELNAASTSALSNAEALQNENRALQDEKIALEKENEELQAKLDELTQKLDEASQAEAWRALSPAAPRCGRGYRQPCRRRCRPPAHWRRRRCRSCR